MTEHSGDLAANGQHGPAESGPHMAAASGKRRWKLTRRGFLGGVGATGLATAAVAFGPAVSSEALVDVLCCTLFRSPSGGQTQCMNHAHSYTWYCSISVDNRFYECTCCENNFSSGCSSVTQSYGICYD
jgi:hypothetical protein